MDKKEETKFEELNDYLKADLECKICLGYSDDIFECSDCEDTYCKKCLLEKLKGEIRISATGQEPSA